MPEVFSYFNRPPTVPGPRGKSMADSSFRDEVDVNNIVARYMRTGLWPQATVAGFFEDVSLLPDDLMSAHAALQAAEARFMELPAAVRAKFGNSPVRLLEMLSDPASRDQALESLGARRKEAEPVPEGAGKASE